MMIKKQQAKSEEETCRLCNNEKESWIHIWTDCPETIKEREEAEIVECLQSRRILLAKLLDAKSETKELLRMGPELDQQNGMET